MSHLSQQEVERLFEPYRTAINRIVAGAWAEWLASKRTWRFRRSRANFMFVEMIQRALAEFQGDAQIHPIRRHETYVFVVNGELVFRFKKGDEAGLTANYPTQAAIEFHDPEQELPGLPQAVRVDVVYVPNKLETQIQDILVVGRAKSDVEWIFSLLPPASNENVVPIPDRAEQNQPDSSVVRVKKQPNKDQEPGAVS